MNPDAITISPGPRLRAALLLAIVADAFQMFSPLYFSKALLRPLMTFSTFVWPGF